MSVLRFEDVTVRYGSRRHGVTALDRVSLEVPEGSVLGLVGESGSGKSTLARAAVGIAPLEGGRILFDEAPLPTTGRRPIQMVFQDPYASLDPRMTIGESIAEALPRGLSRPERDAEVRRLLTQVHLDPARATAFPAHLSGGQRQRVALARALGGQPRVLIADEITSALDVSIQGAVLNLVRELQRELGLAILFISHNLAVVRSVASHIAVMYLGQIVEHGTADRVLSQPQHPYTRDLLAAIPRLHGSASTPVVEVLEAVDPHHPPPGCRYHTRCPIGPLVLPDREVCRQVEPSDQHLQHATCHFAPPIAAGAAAVATSQERSTP
ncbi:MAG: oligopeptide/dipeptide ABC transporter ATP-binding protein [Chloroflexota bacterium]